MASVPLAPKSGLAAGSSDQEVSVVDGNAPEVLSLGSSTLIVMGNSTMLACGIGAAKKASACRVRTLGAPVQGRLETRGRVEEAPRSGRPQRADATKQHSKIVNCIETEMSPTVFEVGWTHETGLFRRPEPSSLHPSASGLWLGSCVVWGHLRTRRRA